MAVDCEDGQPGYILQLNNFLDFSNSMEHSLLCPIHARLNGIRIDDTPTSLSPNSSQAVILDDDNAILIYYHGPISFIHIHYPTDNDLGTYKWYQLTNNSTWLPYDLDLQISSVDVSNECCKDLDLFHDSNELYHRVANSVIISGINSKSKDDSVTAETLAKRWRIPLEKVRDTLNATTHGSIRTKEGRMSRDFGRTHIKAGIGGWEETMLVFIPIHCSQRSKPLETKHVPKFILTRLALRSFIP